MANLFLSFGRSAGETVAGGGVAGNNANDATTFANRVMDITSGITAARTAAGDVIRIMKSEDPVSLGINATWTNKSNTVTLASALTTNVYLDGAWTASANVTCTTSTTRKEGSNSSSNAIAAAFTTGKASYYATGTLDLSSYNKISFWIRASATVAAGVLRIDLCSDTAGATPVNSLTIADNLTVNNWKCITIDNGAGLGASIQSVALYCVSDPGTVTVLIDNIVACNALTLTSLISKNSSATSKEFYPIQSINSTTVKLDYAPDSSAADTVAGYYGTTETVTTYKREPIRILSSGAQSTNEAGSGSARSLFSGGWNTTDMTTQDGLTFVDVGDDNTQVFAVNYSYLDWENIVAVRGTYGFALSGAADVTLTNCASIGKGSTTTSTGGFNVNSARIKMMSCAVYACAGYGLTVRSGAIQFYLDDFICNSSQSGGVYYLGASNLAYQNNVTCNNSLSVGVSFDGSVVNMRNVTAKDCSTAGVATATASVAHIRKITTSGNGSAGVAAFGGGIIYLDDTDCTDTTPLSASSSGRVQASRVGGVTSTFRIYDIAGNTILAQYDTGTVHGTTTQSIKHSPTATHGANFPFIHAMGVFACDSTGTLTVSVYVRRSNSTNVAARLVIRGGQVDGVTTDQTDDASAASNTWEQLTISCSPTEKVMIEVELHSWQTAGAGDVFWGDFDVTQA